MLLLRRRFSLMGPTQLLEQGIIRHASASVSEIFVLEEVELSFGPIEDIETHC